MPKKLQSKFKHLFANTPKPEQQFLDLKQPYTTGESAFVACSAKQTAIAKAGGGGPVYVLNNDTPGRLKSSMSVVNVHSGKVLDMEWNPFVGNMLATASDDTKVKCTMVPANMDECKENVTEADITLTGHGKKVHLLKWSPTANSILATSAWDKTVKVWNVETSEVVHTYESFKEPTLSMEWNYDGSLIAATTKDKQLKLFDPRVPDKDVSCVESFAGTKSSKVFWMKNFNCIGATGFNKQAKRMIRIWDLKALDKGPVYSEIFDQMSSVLMPYYDNEHGLLFVAGKGDGTVTYMQIHAGGVVQSLSSYRSNVPQKGGNWIPKHATDTKNCEIAKFMKLTKDSVIPLSFQCPRKNKDMHHKDLYPDCAGPLPSLSAEEWQKGENKDPVMIEMDPAKRGDGCDTTTTFEKKKTYGELAKENEELKAKIAELEAKLAES